MLLPASCHLSPRRGRGWDGEVRDPSGKFEGACALTVLCAAPLSPRRDPDNVVLCLLAADEDDDRDVALQIHFTLIQAFCCENDINILRVSNPGRLAELLLLGPDASPAASEGATQPPDLHCVLVTVSGRGHHGPGRAGQEASSSRGQESPACRPGGGGGVTSAAAFAPLKSEADFQPRWTSFVIRIFSGKEHV